MTPPDISDALNLPDRLAAVQPFREAQWPFDMASNLLFAGAFGALALVAGPIAGVAHGSGRGVLRSAMILSGTLGVTAAALYIGGTQVTIAQSYCDCGFRTEELIGRFWALEIVQGAANWLGYGAIAVGAIAVLISTVAVSHPVLSGPWRWIGVSAAAMLMVSIPLHEVSDTPLGDLVVAVATGVLLPIWALILARRFADLSAADVTPTWSNVEPAP